MTNPDDDTVPVAELPSFVEVADPIDGPVSVPDLLRFAEVFGDLGDLGVMSRAWR